jgi:hypothetical protein
LIVCSKKVWTCDGVITAEINEKSFAYIGFIEGKNEIGIGECDPSVQGAICYRDYWSQDNVCLILFIFNLLVTANLYSNTFLFRLNEFEIAVAFHPSLSLWLAHGFVFSELSSLIG